MNNNLDGLTIADGIHSLNADGSDNFASCSINFNPDGSANLAAQNFSIDLDGNLYVWGIKQAGTATLQLGCQGQPETPSATHTLTVKDALGNVYKLLAVKVE